MPRARDRAAESGDTLVLTAGGGDDALRAPGGRGGAGDATEAVQSRAQPERPDSPVPAVSSTEARVPQASLGQRRGVRHGSAAGLGAMMASLYPGGPGGAGPDDGDVLNPDPGHQGSKPQDEAVYTEQSQIEAFRGQGTAGRGERPMPEERGQGS